MDDLSREIVEVVSEGRFSYILKVKVKRVMQGLLVESKKKLQMTTRRLAYAFTDRQNKFGWSTLTV